MRDIRLDKVVSIREFFFSIRLNLLLLRLSAATPTYQALSSNHCHKKNGTNELKTIE